MVNRKLNYRSNQKYRRVFRGNRSSVSSNIQANPPQGSDSYYAMRDGWVGGYGVTASDFVFNEWGNIGRTRFNPDTRERMTPRQWFWWAYNNRGYV